MSRLGLCPLLFLLPRATSPYPQGGVTLGNLRDRLHRCIPYLLSCIYFDMPHSEMSVKYYLWGLIYRM